MLLFQRGLVARSSAWLILVVDRAIAALAVSQAANYYSDMKSRGFTYWQDGDAWLGYLDDFPDYLTQGKSVDDLKAHLLSLYEDLVSGEIPCVRRHGELESA